jgi:hypothetical protein
MRRALAAACLLGCTPVLGAQQQAQNPGYTGMLLGVGHTLDEAAWSLGFEHKPAGSPVAWRMLLERWDHHAVHRDAGAPNYQERRFIGAQVVGLRLFRQPRRMQPYVLGGLALYQEKVWFGSTTYTLEPDGTPGPGTMTTGETERLNPFIIWGTGLNVRVSRVTLFGEVKLPMPRARGGTFSAAPLLFGVRF